MPRSRRSTALPRAGASALALLCAFALPALAQTSAPGVSTKDSLVNDPAVRRSMEPSVTPLGRNPPNNLQSGSDQSLQNKIDQAHEGTTGSTKENGGTRQPAGQAPELRDGSAPRQTEKP